MLHHIYVYMYVFVYIYVDICIYAYMDIFMYKCLLDPRPRNSVHLCQSIPIPICEHNCKTDSAEETKARERERERELFVSWRICIWSDGLSL